MIPSRDELIKSEDARINFLNEDLDRWSDLRSKIYQDYTKHIVSFQKERREILKYFGTIAAGAAALAPQTLNYVEQPIIFYWGIFFLLVAMTMSITYVLATVEKESEALSLELERFNKLIDNYTKPLIGFAKGGDYGIEAFKKAVGGREGNIFNEIISEKKKEGWYRSMDYVSEYVAFSLFMGITLFTISLTSIVIPPREMAWISIGVFLIINVISTFPRQVFQILGVPMDLIKSLLRNFLKLKENK